MILNWIMATILVLSCVGTWGAYIYLLKTIREEGAYEYMVVAGIIGLFLIVASGLVADWVIRAL